MSLPLASATSHPATSKALRETRRTLLVAALIAALGDSHGLMTWARDLEPGPLAEQIRLVAYAWHVTMERFGVTALGELLRGILG